MTFVEKCRRYPIFGASAVAMLLFCGVPAIIWLVALVVPLPPFVPSTVLKDFALISAVPIALLGFVPFVVPVPWVDKPAPSAQTLSKKIGRIAVILFSPFLVAFIWVFFLHRPAGLVLHAMASKQQQTVVERVIKTDSTSLRDAVCPSGMWAAVIDNSFWWPRKVCDISYQHLNAYRNGGTITLQGNVSRFGITYSSYSFSSDTNTR
jgi:hypothetical protein